MPAGSDSVIARDGGGSGSTSIVTTETATGWHVLKVEGYSKLGKLGVGKCRRSGTFSVGGHAWSIIYYLDGHDKESADWIAVGVTVSHPAGDSNIRAQVKLSILDKDGEPVSEKTGVHTFSSTCPPSSRGFPRFIERQYLLESPYFINDGFCIRCHLTVWNETCEVSVVPPPDLHEHLGNLLTSGVGADVTFEVGEETFVAHKNVLAARSSVFMAEFFSCPMKEKVTENIQVEGIDANVFKTMLHFIYTDSLPDLDGDDKMVMVQHLLVAADRYNMERLKLICENFLCTHMNSSIVATTLVLAEQHNCIGLMEACIKFLESPGNLKVVMAGDDLQHLKNSCPCLVDKLLAKVVP